MRIGVGHIESRDSYGQDLVGRFRHLSLDSFLVGIAENRGHGESTQARVEQRERIIGDGAGRSEVVEGAWQTDRSGAVRSVVPTHQQVGHGREDSTGDP